MDNDDKLYTLLTCNSEYKIRQAIELAICYGQTDGAHHKAWVIDQMVRTLVDNYDEFKEAYENDGEYYWDEGIAP